MKFSSPSLPIVLLLAAPAVFAQTLPDPVIRSIEPNTAATSGGTVIAVSGENFAPPRGFACILPCPPRMVFGDTAVDAQYDSDTVLVAKAPAHAPGVVDITVRTPDNRSATAKSAFTFTSSQEASYERLLLPVNLDTVVAGANGSRWRTDFWLRNDSGDPVTLAPFPCPPDRVCPAVFPLTQVLAGGETLHNLPPFAGAAPGNPSRVLFATKNAHVSANLRIFDESRSTVDAGAEIPVVRERDLLTSTAQLHAVPLNAVSRVMLRVYDLAQTTSRFRVRFFAESEGVSTAAPFHEEELVAQTNQNGEFRWQAAYADYGRLNSLLVQPTIYPSLVRVEVEPLTSGSRFWAFISVTNNDTQRVTLITP